MTPKELLKIGTRLKSLGSTRGDLLDYIEGTLPLLTMRPQTIIAPTFELSKPLPPCPTCAKRRKQKADAQKKWRKNRPEIS